MTKTRNSPNKVFNDVEIIDIADEGLAIGRCQDGLIIQVKGAVPGDRVDVKVNRKRKGMYFTEILQASALSDNRTDPFCSHFGTCGGCKWQHMSYRAQLMYKEKKVRDAFRRIGDLDTQLIKPIAGAPLQTYYRNKLEFTASGRRWLSAAEMMDPDKVPDKEGLGFHLAGAFDKVLDIDHCYLQADPSNDIRHFIKNFCLERNWSFFDLKRKEGFLRNLIIRNNLDGECLLVLVLGEQDTDKITSLISSVTDQFHQVISVFSCINTKVNDSIHDLEVRLEYGRDALMEKLGTLSFRIGPKSFFQTNSMQAGTLYGIAKELAELQPGDNVYDLYCGVGSLGLFMADHCDKVVGIEQIGEAVLDARVNAEINGITNANFIEGQVELLIDPSFIEIHGRPDVIFTDPPRAGMHPDAVKYIIQSGASKIVYVSCNPSTQARDLKLLNQDYRLISAVPVDMFPHTHHIECVALLERK